MDLKQSDEDRQIDESLAAAKREAINEAMEKRREEMFRGRANKDTSESEALRNIIQKIDDMHSDLQRRIEEITSSGLEGTALNGLFDNIAGDFVASEKVLSEHCNAIPSFELRKAQRNLNDLQNKFKEIQNELQPKKKFGFKGKRPSKAIDANVSSDKEVKNPSFMVKNIATPLGDSGYVVKDKTNETVFLSSSDVTGQDVLLSNMKNCKIHIKGNPSTLHLTKFNNCTVLCGPVSTSIMIEECCSSTLVLACQQLRIHQTSKSDFYIWVTSRAIIEDCNGVRFAPFELTYDNIQEDLKASGLNMGSDANNWDKVNDFNWLSSTQPSPNWTIISEHERKKQSF